MAKFNDLTGKVFGKLSVVGRAVDVIYPSKTLPQGQRLTAWTCRCECGNIKNIVGIRLRHKTSCGCENKTRANKKYIGKKFGRLTICSRGPSKGDGRIYWVCKCECSKNTIVLAQSIYQGKTKSCGCLWEERKLEKGLASKHRMFRLSKIHAEKRRLDFSLSFEEFVRLRESPCAYCGIPPYKHASGIGYNGGWINNGIDRIDSNKGYVLNNCNPCCEPCNQAKNDRTVDEFINHVRRITEYQSRQPRGPA